MPLRPGAKEQIRANLAKIANGERVPFITIADLTEKQLADINANRSADELPPIIGEVVFLGKHLYDSRIKQNQYTIDETVEFVENAMSAESVFRETVTMTAIENPNPRINADGKRVNDRALFECSRKHPRPELISAVPAGDGRAPEAKGKGRSKAALVKSLADSPG
jgi:hypothetical protein